MSKPRRCLVCGGPYYGYAKDRVKLHDICCTPELRALVRAALWEYDLGTHHPTCNCRFCRAVVRWLKAKERRTK